jgi:ankyrin repeat protein
MAADIGSISRARKLLKAGAGVNYATARFRETAVMATKSVRMLRFFIQNGAHTDAQTSQENGLLHIQCIKGYYEMMVVMIEEYGLEMAFTNKRGKTVWRMLRSQVKHVEANELYPAEMVTLFKFLLLRGPVPNSVMDHARPDLVALVEQGNNLRQNLRARNSARRIFLARQAPVISRLPSVLQNMVLAFEAPMTTTEVWADPELNLLQGVPQTHHCGRKRKATDDKKS